MGFISFNEEYYRRKLEEYENKILSDAEIREAKQLLKVLDDLTDEGYTNLNDTMEEDFSCFLLSDKAESCTAPMWGSSISYRS